LMINRAVTQLDDVNQGNAALVEETAAASSSLNQQASELISIVSLFKIAVPEDIPMEIAAESMPATKIYKSVSVQKSEEKEWANF